MRDREIWARKQIELFQISHYYRFLHRFLCRWSWCVVVHGAAADLWGDMYCCSGSTRIERWAKFEKSDREVAITIVEEMMISR